MKDADHATDPFDDGIGEATTAILTVRWSVRDDYTVAIQQSTRQGADS